jgi:hypothetical protein
MIQGTLGVKGAMEGSLFDSTTQLAHAQQDS